MESTVTIPAAKPEEKPKQPPKLMSWFDHIVEEPTGLNCADFMDENLLDMIMLDLGAKIDHEKNRRNQLYTHLFSQQTTAAKAASSNSSSIVVCLPKPEVPSSSRVLSLPQKRKMNDESPTYQIKSFNSNNNNMKLTMLFNKKNPSITHKESMMEYDQIQNQNTINTNTAFSQLSALQIQPQPIAVRQLDKDLKALKKLSTSQKKKEKKLLPQLPRSGFKCPDCNSFYKEKVSYLAHTALKNRLKCLMCPEMFSCENSWSAHCKSNHMLEIPKLMPECPICNNEFVSQNRLLVHLLTHVCNKEYECRFCHRKYKTSRSVQAHLKTHASELDFISIDYNHLVN